MKKLLIIGIVSLLGAAGYFFAAKHRSEEAPLLTMTVEAKNDYEIEEVVPSVLQPITERYLSVRRGGKLEDILAEPGEPVTAGTTLGVVDKAKRVADLERAFSNYKLAQTDMNRIDNLQRRGAATRQEWDDAKNRLSVSKTELKNAKQDLEDSVVRSPIDGILSFFAFRIGDFVPDGSRVAVVEDRTRLRAIVKIPFAIATRLKNTLDMKIRAFNPVAGKAVGKAITTQAQTKLLAITSDYDAGKRDVELEFAPPPGFAVGQAVMISFVAKTYPQVAVVPTESLLQQDGKDVVIIRRDGALTYEPVVVIDATTTQTVIEPLRNEGDVIKPTPAAKQKLARSKPGKQAG